MARRDGTGRSSRIFRLAHWPMTRRCTIVPPLRRKSAPRSDLSFSATFVTRSKALRALLDSPNVASKKWVYRQYDSIVQSNTVLGPGQ